MKKRYTKEELAVLLLKRFAVEGLVVACVALPGLAQVFTLFRASKAQDRHRIRQSIRGLEKQEFIRRYKHKGEEVIEITEKGKRRIVRYDLKHLLIKRPKKWDGLWRVVIFDIPEEKRGRRLFVSRQFKSMGMHTLQRSTFISPFPCKGEADFIGEYLDIRKYIIYMEVSVLDELRKWKRKFNLA